jgi:hypothetical protein
MPVTFDSRVRIPEDVLISELDGESVLLNLKSEAYFGLDDVGTRMWGVVTSANSIAHAFETLSGEFDVEPGTLRKDLEDLLDALLQRGLLEVAG